MKIPTAPKGNVVQMPQQVPAAYLAMAAAHMEKLGKLNPQPTAPSGTPDTAQISAALKGPNASGQ